MEISITYAELGDAVSTVAARCVDAGLGARVVLESVLCSLIITALREHGGNESAAASALGMHRNTLGRHMRRFGIARLLHIPRGRRGNGRGPIYRRRHAA